MSEISSTHRGSWLFGMSARHSPGRPSLPPPAASGLSPRGRGKPEGTIAIMTLGLTASRHPADSSALSRIAAALRGAHSTERCANERHPAPILQVAIYARQSALHDSQGTQSTKERSLAAALGLHGVPARRRRHVLALSSARVSHLPVANHPPCPASGTHTAIDYKLQPRNALKACW